MISHLEIRNFQAHAHLDLDITEPIASIIGPSDRGKSAILRAIRWVLLNEAPGRDFILHGEKTASVKVVVDGRSLTRSISGSTNLYILDDQEYRAFGREVPEDIAKFLRVSGINFQGQHDTPFWLSIRNGAEISRSLNQIVNLELIDQVLSRLDSILRSARTVLAERTERLDEARAERKRLQFVPEMLDDLKFLQIMEQGLASAKEQHSKLLLSLNLWEEADSSIIKMSMALSDVLHVIAKGNSFLQARQQHSQLQTVITRYGQSEREAQLPVPDTSEASKLAGLIGKKRAKYRGLASLLAEVDSLLLSLQPNQDGLSKTQAAIKALTKGRCPLCGAPNP